jgi:hypothetical protein
LESPDREIVTEARRIASDVLGCFTYAEDALREAIGNTNYTVILDEAKRLDAALSQQQSEGSGR